MLACPADFLGKFHVCIYDFFCFLLKFFVSRDFSRHSELSSDFMRGTFVSIDDHLHECLGIWGANFSLVHEKDQVTQFFVAESLLDNCLEVFVLLNAVAIDMVVNPKLN